jgi:hypothetical protein
MINANIKKMEKLVTLEMENRHMPKFEKQARYLGNNVYSISGTNLVADDTRKLFLMFCLVQEGIKIPQLAFDFK